MKMRSRMSKANNQKGFTLVELMVVVVIIGVLVAIAVPVYRGVQGTAEESACFANQRTIDGAIQAYRAQEGEFPADIGDLVDAELLTEEPACPVGDVAYELNATGDAVAACDEHGSY